MNKRVFHGAIALLMMSAVTVESATAQAAPERRRAVRGSAVESIMSMRDRLELTDDQISALDRIRAERVQERSTLRAEMAEMRSRLQAGQIRQSEMMAFLEDRADARRDDAEERQAEIEAILDEAQIEMLDDLRTRTRAFVRGRASARGGRGVRGARGPRMDDDRLDRRRSGRRSGFGRLESPAPEGFDTLGFEDEVN